MKYEIISEKDAPVPSAKTGNAAAEAQSIIMQLRKGVVARIEPEGKQTIRGLRVNLGRAAKRAGVKLQTWDVDGLLYVKLAS